MRIAFDGTALRPGRTGVGYYTEHLLHHLARTATDDELKQMAAGLMRGERADHTWQPTDLVHEALLRLLGTAVQSPNRRHFFAVASRTMREVLVKHARSRAAKGWRFPLRARGSRSRAPEARAPRD